MPLINADGCPVHVEVAGPERAPVPPVIIGRDDRGRDEPASETIGRHSVSEIGCDGTTRCAASLDAALDVRAQRLSPRGRLCPIDLGLLWIAGLDATGFGGSQLRPVPALTESSAIAL